MKKIIPFVLLELYRTSVSQKVPYFLILDNFPRWNIILHSSIVLLGKIFMKL